MPRNTYNAVTIDNAVDWSHPLNRGRVAWWLAPPGIAAAGSRMLDLCGRNHGTLVGQTPSLPIWTNDGFRFDGATQYAIAPSSAQISPRVSVTAICTVVLSRLGQYQSFIIKSSSGSWAAPYADYALRVTISNQFQGWVIDGGNSANYVSSTATAVAGLTYRIGMSYDGSRILLSVNGNVIASQSVSGAIPANGGAMYLGSNSGNSDNLGGKLTDISIWGRAFTATDFSSDCSASSVKYRTPDSPLRWVRGVRYFAPLSAGPAPQTRFFPSMAGMGWC